MAEEKTEIIDEVLQEEELIDLDTEASQEDKPFSPSQQNDVQHMEESEQRTPSPPASNDQTDPMTDARRSSAPGKECCKACLKEARNNGRACICQVPSSRRRTLLGQEGCITCGCTGCHPEDLEKRSKDRSSASGSSTSGGNGGNNSGREHLKNGCCKACMKAFSETKKACLCQVPIYARLSILPPEGCTICKCKGCHPEEVLMRKRGWIPPAQSNAIGAYAGMYPYYQPYLPYFSYGQSDHYGHHGHHPLAYDARDARWPQRYPDEWYHYYNDRTRSPERHDRKQHRRSEEASSRKRERDSEWSHDSRHEGSNDMHQASPDRRSRSHRARSRSSSPKRSRN